MKRIVILVLVLMLVLVACGGEDDGAKSDGGLESAADSNTATSERSDVNPSASTDLDGASSGGSVVGNIRTAEANVFEMPAVEGLDGKLLFVQGNASSVTPSDGDSGRLFLANFDGSQPQMLATRVYTTSVSLSPDKTHVFYTAIEGRSWYTHLLNLDTLEVAQLAQLQSRFGVATSWSPDGQWLTFSDAASGNNILTKVDGASRLDLNNGNIFWTQDNQIVFINFQFDQSTQTTLTEVQLIDPLTQEMTVLDVPIDFTNGTFRGPDFVEILAQDGYALSTNYWAAGQNGNPMFLPDEESFLNIQNLTPGTGTNNSAPLCAQFQLSEHTLAEPAGEVFYDVEDTLTITDVKVHDGGYFLERWYLNNCNFNLENLNISLEYVKLGEEPQVIAEDIYPGVDVNPNFMRANNGVKYAVSPDGNYVVWIEGSFATLTTSLKITDLINQETQDLMTWTASSSNNFVIFDAFTSVFWID